MTLHRNAKTCPESRKLLARRICDQGWSLRAAAEAAGISEPLVRGSRDPIIPQPWAEEATALLPNGRLEVIPGQTHTIVISGAQQLAEVVIPFLSDEVDGRGEGATGSRKA